VLFPGLASAEGQKLEYSNEQQIFFKDCEHLENPLTRSYFIFARLSLSVFITSEQYKFAPLG
jgi:hypothetical protein